MYGNNHTEAAIQAALEGKWPEAKELNLKIIKEDPNNIAALNRLGRAYLELNKIKEALNIYQQVLRLDRYNPIAKKNLARIKTKQKSKNNEAFPYSAPPIRVNFLEEPGKTKTSQLVRLADAELIANLQIGQTLILETKKRQVCLKTEDNLYVGSLPDDLCFRLIKMIKACNKYEVLIKSIEGHSVQVFIREIKRSQKLKNTPSFLTSSGSNYHAEIRHAMLSEEPLDTTETGEETEN